MAKLPRSFYERDDVTLIARELLGKTLVSSIDGVNTSGRIVETEAYAAKGDKACHAHLGRFTKRTKTMFKAGGTAYVYLCYGIHHLFNVVTNVEGTPEAVLIRAIEPLDGSSEMMKRREMNKIERRLTAGPGILSQALGITKTLDGTDLCQSDTLWIEENGTSHQDSDIETGPRVGIGYAGEDALLPWRFSVKGTKWKSPAK